MTFTSIKFLIFFSVVLILFNLIPRKGKVWFLLAASYFFYIILQPIYVLLLVGVTFCTYLFTRAMANTESEKKKQRLLVLGIISIILPLFFFKYFVIINKSVISLLDNLGLHIALPEISFLLPIGISFYTFMAIGYLADVYNEDVEFESNIGSISLFLSFFPIILSGPIERAGNMFPQFKNFHNSSYDGLVAGAKMMLWGYFMKLCVANRLGIYVDDVFSHIQEYNGSTLAFASILYPFQLYADLGGYSLIAIGVARCLGIRVISNFNRPFFATSMSEFWRRWHISLIQWLTDYIYTPLSFTLKSWKIWGIVSALVLTFLISGIWHGAALTFIIWGLIQGVFLSIEAATQKSRSRFEQRKKLKKNPWYLFICSVCVFVIFSFSQIFGKSPSIKDALTVVGKILTEWGTPYLNITELSFGLIALAILLLNDFSEEYFASSFKLFNNKYIVVRYLSYLILVFMIIIMGEFGGEKFIYFQF
jgi:D-alanyl-lipoteichoic acid acyltransferase DltB (MBOAT superfamily)